MTQNLFAFRRIGAGEPKSYTVFVDGVEVGRAREIYRGRFGKGWRSDDLDGNQVGFGSTRFQAAEALARPVRA